MSSITTNEPLDQHHYCESRNGKALRKRLGPPDTFQQEEKQIEDELDEASVRYGFKIKLPVRDEDETGSAVDYMSDSLLSYSKKVETSLDDISKMHIKFNTMGEKDSGKRRLVNSVKEFWMITPRTKKSHVENWFFGLAGDWSMSALSKRVPIINKKEEIFHNICEAQVPLARALWFIKMTATYSISTKKNRSASDLAQEWTPAIISYMKDQLPKLPKSGQLCSKRDEGYKPFVTKDPEGGIIRPGAFAETKRPPPSDNTPEKVASRHWIYMQRLTAYMFEEGPLDRHLFLSWIVEQLQAAPLGDDKALLPFLPFLVKYSTCIAQSLPLARNVAIVCCRQLRAFMTNESLLQQHPGLASDAARVAGHSRSQPPSAAPSRRSSLDVPSSGSHDQCGVPSPASSTACSYDENLAGKLNSLFSACPHHRRILIALSCSLQIAILHAPIAVMWMPKVPVMAPPSSLYGGHAASTAAAAAAAAAAGKKEDKSKGYCPLDELHVLPSELPLPSGAEVEDRELRFQLEVAEENVGHRSKACLQQWCSPSDADSEEAAAVNELLSVLDAVDQHDFQQASHKPGSLALLFEEIFSKVKNQPISEYDQTVVLLMCEWAVTSQRRGPHRALVVARLLRMRDTSFRKAEATENIEAEHEEDEEEDGDDAASSILSVAGNAQPFQAMLLLFLDLRAPALVGGADYSTDNDSAFCRILHLFAEFIQQGLFSFEKYICTLVARGDLLSTPIVTPKRSPDYQGAKSFETDAHTSYGGNDLERRESIDESQRLLNDHFKDMMDLFNSSEDDQSEAMPGEKRRMSLESVASSLPSGKRSRSTSGPAAKAADSASATSTASSDVMALVAARQQLAAFHVALALQLPLPMEECIEPARRRHVSLLGGALGSQAARADDLPRMLEVQAKIVYHLTTMLDTRSSDSLIVQMGRDDAVKAFRSLDCFHQRLLVVRILRRLLPSLDGTFLPQEVTCISPDAEMTLQGSASPEVIGRGVHEISLRQLSFALELVVMSGDVSAVLQLIEYLLHGPVLDEDTAGAEDTDRSKSPATVAGQYPSSSSKGRTNNAAATSTLPLRLAPLIVSLLREYHACVLLSNRQTCSVFAGLIRCLGKVTNTLSCSNEQLVILNYLKCLYSSCPSIQDVFSDVFGKLNKLLDDRFVYKPQPLSVPAEQIMPSVDSVYSVLSAKTMEASGLMRMIPIKSPLHAHAFVSAILLRVQQSSCSSELQPLGRVCAEFASQYKAVSQEVLNAVNALCHPGKNLGFSYFLQRFDLSKADVQRNVSRFVTFLVARQCLDLRGLVEEVFVSGLQHARVKGVVAVHGGQLVCRLLQHLLVEEKLSESASVGSSAPWLPSSEQRSVATLQASVPVTLILSVLKSLLKLSNGNFGASRIGSSGLDAAGRSSHMGAMKLTTAGTGILPQGFSDGSDSDSNPDQNEAATSQQDIPLAKLAGMVLQDICGQVWLREQCLRHSDLVCSKEILLDPVLKPAQAQELLRLICYPPNSSNSSAGSAGSYQSGTSTEMVSRIMAKLDQWNLRAASLELQLLIHQNQSSGSVLDAIASCAMSIFREEQSRQQAPTNPVLHACDPPVNPACPTVWLVPPLVKNLPPLVHGRMLKAAGELLAGGRWWNPATLDSGKKTSATSTDKVKAQLGAQKTASNCSQTKFCNAASIAASRWQKPLLNLVLTCMQSPGSGREEFLHTLQRQLAAFVAAPKEEICPQDEACRKWVEDALQLRLNLVGCLFGVIHQNTNLSMEWALLLLQILASGAIHIDTHSSRVLFTSVVDMAGCLLVDASYMAEQVNQVDENSRRQALPMLKRVKELVSSDVAGMHLCRCFLPIPQPTLTVPIVEELPPDPEAGVSTVAASMTSSSDIRPRGFRVIGQQEVNAWDLLQGQRGPLSWSWFGGIRHDRHRHVYAVQHHGMLLHDHGPALDLFENRILGNPSPDSVDHDLAGDKSPQRPASLPLQFDMSGGGGAGNQIRLSSGHHLLSAGSVTAASVGNTHMFGTPSSGSAFQPQQHLSSTSSNTMTPSRLYPDISLQGTPTNPPLVQYQQQPQQQQQQQHQQQQQKLTQAPMGHQTPTSGTATNRQILQQLSMRDQLRMGTALPAHLSALHRQQQQQPPPQQHVSLDPSANAYLSRTLQQQQGKDAAQLHAQQQQQQQQQQQYQQQRQYRPGQQQP